MAKAKTKRKKKPIFVGWEPGYGPEDYCKQLQEVEELLTESATIGPGKNPMIARRGYTAVRKGKRVRVPATRYHRKKPLVTYGTKSPGPRSRAKGYRPWITREGKLGGKGFLSKPRAEQERLLTKCVKGWGYRSCLGSVMVLERSGAIRAKHGRKLAGLRRYLVRKFGRGALKKNPGYFDLVPEIAGATGRVQTNPEFEAEMRSRGNPGRRLGAGRPPKEEDPALVWATALTAVYLRAQHPDPDVAEARVLEAFAAYHPTLKGRCVDGRDLGRDLDRITSAMLADVRARRPVAPPVDVQVLAEFAQAAKAVLGRRARLLVEEERLPAALPFGRTVVRRRRQNPSAWREALLRKVTRRLRSEKPQRRRSARPKRAKKRADLRTMLQRTI
jgi:hypothetical protein